MLTIAWRRLRALRSTQLPVLILLTCAITFFSLSTVTYHSAGAKRSGKSPKGVLSYGGAHCFGRYNATVVTAYFNIGPFLKGTALLVRQEDSYVKWLRGFAPLKNPVVFFTDDYDLRSHFVKWRELHDPLHCTAVYLVRRSQLWPWRFLKNISLALRSRNYTYSPPCTTVPSYVAAVNSKYPLIERITAENPFETEYFAWFDAGIFRWRSKSELSETYIVQPLPDLSPSKVGYLQVLRSVVTSFEKIILEHVDWVAGGVFFGRTDVMSVLAREYSEYALKLMSMDLVGADQQVLAAMFISNNSEKIGCAPLQSKLQVYKPHPLTSSDEWFSLAYWMRKRVIGQTHIDVFYHPD